MTKLRLLAFFTALTVMLTACSSETATPSPSVSPTPVKSLPPAEDQHVYFYEEFDRYNNGVDKHDFQVTEVTVNGEPQYCFYNLEYEYPILILPGSPAMNGIYNNAILELHGSELSPVDLELPVLPLGGGNVDGAGDFYLEDLTGDGCPEFVYIYGWGGTGVWADTAKVVDLSSMTRYSVSYDSSVLADGLDVFVGNHTSIEMEDGKLILTTLYMEEDSLPVNYAGSLSVPFAFDPDTSSFTLDTTQITAMVFDDNT